MIMYTKSALAFVAAMLVTYTCERYFDGLLTFIPGLASYLIAIGFTFKWAVDDVKRECDEECGLVTTQLQTNDEDPEATTTDY